ncbi:MAG: TetR/AcrR family transcriptional regulator [Desulfuromonadales bacterium]|nr:TetR/AcrR family transcriptional regulator [Desulfuromonadales bacterium]
MTPEKQDKRNNILRTALELFSEHGFHDAPMAQLAKQADIAVGTIYRYFTDKDELIHELYKEVDDTLQRALVREVDPTISTRQQFVHFVTNLIHYLKDHPHEFKFLEQYYNSPFGIEKKREKLHMSGPSDRKSTFGHFFFGTTKDDIKPLSGHVLHALAFGPVTFLLRDATAGLVKLDESLVKTLAEGCWDAIKK